MLMISIQRAWNGVAMLYIFTLILKLTYVFLRVDVKRKAWTLEKSGVRSHAKVKGRTTQLNGWNGQGLDSNVDAIALRTQYCMMLIFWMLRLTYHKMCHHCACSYSLWSEVWRRFIWLNSTDGSLPFVIGNLEELLLLTEFPLPETW